MKKSFVQFVVTATVEMSPEEFIEKYNTILIERVGIYLHAINGNSVSPVVEDYEIIGVEEV